MKQCKSLSYLFNIFIINFLLRGDTDNYALEEEVKEELSQKDKKIGRKLVKGDYFGAQGFFTGNENMLKAVSQDFSSLMVISKGELEKIL